MVTSSVEPAEDRSTMSRGAVLSILFFILATGTLVRLYHIQHESIWWDEAISLTVASSSFRELPLHFRLNEATPTRPSGWNAAPNQVWEYNPPVYFALLHAWLKSFGYGVLQARLMSVVAGVMALVVLFKIGRNLYDPPTALIATLLLAVSQLGVMYSQEVRHYEVLLLFFLLTVHFYVIARLARSLFAWCCCTIFAVLMVGTHYYGSLAVLAVAVHLARDWRRAPLPRAWLIGAALSLCVALLPWLVFTGAGQIDAVRLAAPPRWSAVRLTTVISVLNKFNNGAVDGIVATMPRWTFLMGAALFTLPVLMTTLRWVRMRTPGSAESFGTSLCVIAGALPVLLVLSFGLAHVKFDIRYVAFCIAPYYLLAAAGIRRMQSRFIRLGVIIAIVTYSGYALRANYWIPYHEDFRGAAQYVAARSLDDDCYAFVPFAAPPLGWTIYMPGPPKATVLAANSDPISLRRCQRTWVITYERGGDEVPIPEDWRKWLTRMSSSHVRLDTKQFVWISVQLFQPSAEMRDRRDAAGQLDATRVQGED